MHHRVAIVTGAGRGIGAATADDMTCAHAEDFFPGVETVEVNPSELIGLTMVWYELAAGAVRARAKLVGG